MRHQVWFQTITTALVGFMVSEVYLCWKGMLFFSQRQLGSWSIKVVSTLHCFCVTDKSVFLHSLLRCPASYMPFFLLSLRKREEKYVHRVWVVFWLGYVKPIRITTKTMPIYIYNSPQFWMIKSLKLPTYNIIVILVKPPHVLLFQLFLGYVWPT